MVSSRVDEAGNTGGKGFKDTRQRGRSGGAKDQRDAVNNKTGGKGAQQEVFEAGFLRIRPGAGKGSQHIKGDGEQFQRQEDDDQVGGMRHQDHA